MNQTQNARLTPNAKTLRKTMTKEERRLWYECLKQLPVTVNRQKVIGRYIVDFYCAAAKVVIELDGSQHFDEAAMAADRERDAYLEGLGLTVLRYTNLEVNRKFKDVYEDVYRHIMKISTSSPPAGGASPGRNHRLLPALAKNMPLACFLNASRLKWKPGSSRCLSALVHERAAP